MEWCELTILAGASSLSDVSNVITSTRSFKVVITTHELSYPSLQCPWVWLVSTVASTMQSRPGYIMIFRSVSPPRCHRHSALGSSPRSVKFNCGLNTFKASNGRDVAVKQQNRAQSNWTNLSCHA